MDRFVKLETLELLGSIMFDWLIQILTSALCTLIIITTPPTVITGTRGGLLV